MSMYSFLASRVIRSVLVIIRFSYDEGRNIDQTFNSQNTSLSPSHASISATSHYDDVMWSHITGHSNAYWKAYAGADRKNIKVRITVREIYRWPVNSPHRGPVTRNIWWCHHDLYFYVFHNNPNRNRVHRGMNGYHSFNHKAGDEAIILQPCNVNLLSVINIIILLIYGCRISKLVSNTWRHIPH